MSAIEAHVTGVHPSGLFFAHKGGTIFVQTPLKTEYILAFYILSQAQQDFEQRVCQARGEPVHTGPWANLRQGKAHIDAAQFARDNRDVVKGKALDGVHLNFSSMLHPFSPMLHVNERTFSDLVRVAFPVEREANDILRNAEVTVIRRKPFVGYGPEVPVLCVRFSNWWPARQFSFAFRGPKALGETFCMSAQVRVHLHHSALSLTSALARAGLSLQATVFLQRDKLEQSPGKTTTANEEYVARGALELFCSARQGSDTQDPRRMAHQAVFCSKKKGVPRVLGTLAWGGGKPPVMKLYELKEAVTETKEEEEEDEGERDLSDFALKATSPCAPQRVACSSVTEMLYLFAQDVASEDVEYFVSFDGFFGSRLASMFEASEHQQALNLLRRVSERRALRPRDQKRDSGQGAGDTKCKVLQLDRPQLDLKHMGIGKFKPDGTEIQTILSLTLNTASVAACASWALLQHEVWQIEREVGQKARLKTVHWLITLLAMLRHAELDGSIVMNEIAASSVFNATPEDLQTKGQFPTLMGMFYLYSADVYFLNTEMFKFGDYPRAMSNTGGNVIEPLTGLWLSYPHFMYDFVSMYPNIIITHNLCPTTLVSDQKARELREKGFTVGVMMSFAKRTAKNTTEHAEEHAVKGADAANSALPLGDGETDELASEVPAEVPAEAPAEAPAPAECVKSTVTNVALNFVQRSSDGAQVTSLLSHILRKLMKQRKHFKDLMGQEKDSAKAKFYDALQKAYKVACNAVFGILMLVYPAMGNCITTQGRLDQQLAVTHGTSVGVGSLEVAMGDTDSVMFKGKLDIAMRNKARAALELQAVEDPNNEEAWWRAYDEADAHTTSGSRAMKLLFENPEVMRLHMGFGLWLQSYFARVFVGSMEFQFENFFLDVLLLDKKKQYVARGCTLDFKAPTLASNFKIKNQGLSARRDLPPLFSNFLQEAPLALCKEHDARRALQLFLDVVSAVRSSATAPATLAFSVQVKNATGESALLQGAVLRQLRAGGIDADPGDSLKYLFVCGAGTKAADNVKALLFYDPAKHAVDVNKYLARFLTYAQSLLASVIDPEDLERYAYNQRSLPASFLGPRREPREKPEDKASKKAKKSDNTEKAEKAENFQRMLNFQPQAGGSVLPKAKRAKANKPSDEKHSKKPKNGPQNQQQLPQGWSVVSSIK